MSHFTVLVIGDDVDAQLAPYNEQTEEQQYLEFVDTEDKLLEDFQTGSVEMVRSPEGELFYRWDERFKVPGSDPFNSSTVIPEDYVLESVPHRKRYANFEEFCRDWDGASRDDQTGRIGYWSNPNAKWDWYEIGGRWAGFFKLKTTGHKSGRKVNFDKFGFSAEELEELITIFRYNKDEYLQKIGHLETALAEQLTKKIERHLKATYPENSVGGTGAFGHKAKPGMADSARKKDIDLDGMRREAAEAAAMDWDEVHAVIDGLVSGYETCETILAKHGEDVDAARAEYHNQDVVKAFRELQRGFMASVDSYLIPREAFIERAANNAAISFAVLKDGEWLEKGRMGWFGHSTEDVPEDEWAARINKMIDELPDDTLLTAVDCHI